MYGYSPYRYAPYSRTREALRGFGTTLRNISLQRAAQEEKKASHLARMAEMGVRKADITGRHEIGKLRALSQIEAGKAAVVEKEATASHRAAMLAESKTRTGIAKTKSDTEREREKYLDETTTAESDARTFWKEKGFPQEEIDESMGKIIEPWMTIPTTRRNLRYLFQEYYPTKKDEIVAGRKAEADKIKAEAELKKEYDNSLIKIKGIERDLANIQKIREKPESLISEKLMESMGILSVDYIADYEQELLKQRDIYGERIAEYESKPIIEELTREKPPGQYKGKHVIDPDTNWEYWSDGTEWKFYKRH